MPFEVPENWEWVNIMEILLKLTDGTHHSPKNYPKGNYKYITAKNIKNEGVVLDDVTYVDDGTHHEIFSRCNPEYGDILYIKDGATTGVVAINNLTEDFSLLSSVALLKPSKLVSNKYLFYYLQSSYCYESVRSSMKGVGITRITLKQIADWDVPIPPIGEQHRIVEYIDSLFSQIDLIAKDTSILKSFLEKYKHGILDLAIAGKLVPQDPSEETAVELLMRINPTYKSCDNRHYANVPFDLPKTWQLTKLKDLCVFLSRGKSPKYSETDKTYPVFAQKCNLKDGGISLEHARFLDPTTVSKWKDVYKLQDGDILINSTGTGTVCRTRLFKTRYLNNYPFVVPDSHVSVIRLHKLISPEYAYIVLSSNASQSYMMDNLAGSTNQKELYISVLENLIFPVPPIEEQRRIVYIVKKISEYIDKIAAAL